MEKKPADIALDLENEWKREKGLEETYEKVHRQCTVGKENPRFPNGRAKARPKYCA